MATKEITAVERLEFASGKVGNAVKWMALSGVLTYALDELLTLIPQFDLPKWALLVSVLVINVLTFAVAKFIEGKDKK